MGHLKKFFLMEHVEDHVDEEVKPFEYLYFLLFKLLH